MSCGLFHWGGLGAPISGYNFFDRAGIPKILSVLERWWFLGSKNAIKSGGHGRRKFFISFFLKKTCIFWSYLLKYLTFHRKVGKSVDQQRTLPNEVVGGSRVP